MRLPPLEDSLLWDTSELLTRGDLCVGSCPATIEGNFNYDGTVDAADYLLWKTNFEALASGSEGTAAVPEPTTLLLALLALAAVPLRVRCGSCVVGIPCALLSADKKPSVKKHETTDSSFFLNVNFI